MSHFMPHPILFFRIKVCSNQIHSLGDGYVAFYATPNSFHSNKICLNQFHSLGDGYVALYATPNPFHFNQGMFTPIPFSLRGLYLPLCHTQS